MKKSRGLAKRIWLFVTIVLVWGESTASVVDDTLEPFLPSIEVPRILVRWTSAAMQDLEATERQTFDPLSLQLGVTFRRYMHLSTGSISYHVDGAPPLTDLLRAVELLLEAQADVVFATPVRYRQAATSDTYYSSQWNLHGASGGIRADQAWASSTGAGARVAVLDTGWINHADNGNRQFTGVDMISEPGNARDGDGRDNDPTDMGDWRPAVAGCTSQPGESCHPRSIDSLDAAERDSTWHGILMAGLINARANNSRGIVGAAYDADVLHVRVLGAYGGADEDIIDAIMWVAGAPAGQISGMPVKNQNIPDVINLSLAGTDMTGDQPELSTCSEDYQQAINFARSQGVTVVAAAGNNQADARSYVPANCPGVITVAATNNAGQRALYSNYDAADSTAEPVVDIAAPGGEGSGSTAYYGLSNSGTKGAVSSPSGDRYPRAQHGTSGATAHVSAVVALMRAVNPTLSPTQIENILKSSARPFATGACDGCGAGIVDAQAAVAAVLPPPAASYVGFVQSGYSRSENGGSVSLQVARSGGSQGAASVNYTTVNGSAYAGSDYSASSGSVSWAHGQTGNRTITVHILDDANYEGSETFTVRLSNPSGATLGATSTATVTITDNDSQPSSGVVRFTNVTFHGDESTLEAFVDFERVNGSDGAASVTVATQSGSATAGSDYIHASQTFSWVNGQAGKQGFKITIVDDTDDDDNESFTVKLTNAQGATLASPNTATVSIEDNDEPASPPAGSPTLSWTNGQCYGHHRFSWTAVAEATTYKLYRKPNTSSTWSLRASTSNRAYAENLSPNDSNRYYYGVRACNASGCGPYSNSVGTVYYLDGCQ